MLTNYLYALSHRRSSEVCFITLCICVCGRGRLQLMRRPIVIPVNPQIKKPRDTNSNVFWEQPDHMTELRETPLQRTPLTITNTWTQPTTKMTVCNQQTQCPVLCTSSADFVELVLYVLCFYVVYIEYLAFSIH